MSISMNSTTNPSPPLPPPTLEQFVRAFALIRSRSFAIPVTEQYFTTQHLDRLQKLRQVYHPLITSSYDTDTDTDTDTDYNATTTMTTKKTRMMMRVLIPML